MNKTDSVFEERLGKVMMERREYKKGFVTLQPHGYVWLRRK